MKPPFFMLSLIKTAKNKTEEAKMREKILMDSGWKFHFGDIDIDYPRTKGPVYTQAKTETMKWGPAAPGYCDSADSYSSGVINTDYWEDVNLPHDYIIGQTPDIKNNSTLGYFDYQNAWYRKHFRLSESDRNRRITLYFEGVSNNCTIYINGCILKHNFCGYAPFEADITDFAVFDGENVLAVYINTSHHEGWWYEGAGIYRHVWLIKTAMTAVDLFGVFVNPKKTEDGWDVSVETSVINENTSDSTVSVVTLIKDAEGNTVAETDETEITVKAKDKGTAVCNAFVESPKIWDIDEPNLYYAVTSVKYSGKTVDEVTDRFGFRTFRFDARKGFFLNGRNVKLKGVCCHQDYGITGKAVSDNVYRYRIELMKEMGANAYRTSHYPHAEATMDALDELGLLAMDETRWFTSTGEGKEQLAMLIKRDRNRPSVILWSVGNEEPLHLTERGVRITETLKAEIKKYDPTRPVTTAVSHDAHIAPVVGAVDVIGVNYQLNHYDEIHEKYPDIPFLSSECCATGTTRGWYLPDSAERGYINAFDHDTNEWFLGRERTWKFITDREWAAGAFQWAGIEHRGETVWPRLCSQSGAVDLFLQKKDAFYQNQSHWTDKPMIHLLPHWNHSGRDGEIIDVWAYTNCEEAELFLDGESLGTRRVEKYSHAEWKVPYRSGKLTVSGRNGGKEEASDSAETTGKAVSLGLRLENSVSCANGKDTAIITCFCTDSEGRTVPDAEGYMISFNANSLGTILGTGSDISDHTPVTSLDRRMRAGLCSAAVKVGNVPGTLKIYASAPGLDGASLSIELK